MSTKILILKGKLSSARNAYHKCSTETGKLHYEHVIGGLIGEIKKLEAVNV